MTRPIERGQTQILYRYLPGALFDHDTFGLCKVESIDVEGLEEDQVNDSALFETLQESLAQWTKPEFRANYPEVRDVSDRRRFRVGTPKQVHFTPFPRIVQCTNPKCGYVTQYNNVKDGRSQCPRCKSRMRQLRYVEAHNCGRMQELKLPEACPTCKQRAPRLFDPGRTSLARWVCTNCGSEIRKLRMSPCSCAYAGAVGEDRRHEKFLRVYPAAEPGLFIPQVTAFINFKKRDEERLTQVKDVEALMLAHTWGILESKVLDIARQREQGAASSGDENMRRIMEKLRLIDANDPDVLAFDAAQANPAGEAEIKRVYDLLGSGFTMRAIPPRKLIEHTALRDNMRIITVDKVAERLKERGEVERAGTFKTESSKIMAELGLASVEAIEDFPIAQMAFGFTRVTRDPNRSMINPFHADDGRHPIYVLPTETEGLWFQLDPVAVAAWLSANGFVAGAAPAGKHEAWAWLHRVALQQGFQRNTELSAAASAVQVLIHTISHIMLQRIEWSGFASSSVGEYLLPDTLSFVLYANRFTESKIGGLLTLFEQRLPFWLQEAAQNGRDCVYDPICSREGGSCAGCLHREHNCPHFNHHLSRAVLFGGNLPDDSGLSGRRIKQGFWHTWVPTITK